MMMRMEVVVESRDASHICRSACESCRGSRGVRVDVMVTWCEVNDRIGCEYPLPQIDAGGRGCRESKKKGG